MPFSDNPPPYTPQAPVTAQPAYQPQLSGTAQPGYPAQSGYPGQPGYPAQPGFPAQPGYPAQPGQQPQPGYSPQYGYPQTQQPGYPPQPNQHVQQSTTVVNMQAPVSFLSAFYNRTETPPRQDNFGFINFGFTIRSNVSFETLYKGQFTLSTSST